MTTRRLIDKGWACPDRCCRRVADPDHRPTGALVWIRPMFEVLLDDGHMLAEVTCSMRVEAEDYELPGAVLL